MVGAFVQVLVITFCWQLMAQDKEGLGLEVSSEPLSWGCARHCSLQWDPLPVLGLFKSHPGVQLPASQIWSLAPEWGVPGPQHHGREKAPMGTRVAWEGTQPCQGMQG